MAHPAYCFVVGWHPVPCLLPLQFPCNKFQMPLQPCVGLDACIIQDTLPTFSIDLTFTFLTARVITMRQTLQPLVHKRSSTLHCVYRPALQRHRQVNSDTEPVTQGAHGPISNQRDPHSLHIHEISRAFFGSRVYFARKLCLAGGKKTSSLKWIDSNTTHYYGGEWKIYYFLNTLGG